MSWGYITSLLQDIERHSTYLGKLWFLAFLVLRVVLTSVAGESIYYDEQGQFMCNTRQPGCTNVCYDLYAPLSHVRFWIFHMIAVAIPTILYIAFAFNHISRTTSLAKRQNVGQKPPRPTEEDNGGEDGSSFNEEVELEMLETLTNQIAVVDDSAKHNGRRYIKRDGLMTAYVLQLIMRSIFEVAFLVGQYYGYGLEVPALYQCVREPCRNQVDCFVSRPSEKTIFLLLMYAVGGLCLLISIVEMFHLVIGEVTDAIRVKRIREDVASLFQIRKHGFSEPRGTPSELPSYSSVARPSCDAK